MDIGSPWKVGVILRWSKKFWFSKNVRAPSITEHTSIYGNIPSMVPHRAHWEEFIWGSLAIDTDREKKVVRPPRYLL